MSTAVERAMGAWRPLPDWVRAMAEACDASSQAQAARRMGYSPATVSLVLRNAWSRDLSHVGAAARGAFLSATVDCPVLGTVGTSECVTHQRAKFSTVNTLCVRLYRACRAGCPHSRLTGGTDAV